jgi:CheY-like chemotaxis protein
VRRPPGDVGLPNLSGHKVARRLRTEPWGLAVKRIALTGWGSEDDRRKSREAGFDEHLTKPVDPDAFRSLDSLHAAAARRPETFRRGRNGTWAIEPHR